jgi:soluble lytic murein transglycosylase-like protein
MRGRVGLLLVLFVAAPATAQTGGAEQWSAYIDEAAQRFALPRDWIERVMMAESAGQTTLNGHPIQSSAGAMGLMQLMPATYQDMRLAENLGPDPFDPHDNILAGTAYLRLMFNRYGYPGLFAAYNAGPGRFEASLRGLPLPQETRAYVLKVTASQAALSAKTGLFVPISGVLTNPMAAPTNALFVPLKASMSATETPNLPPTAE